MEAADQRHEQRGLGEPPESREQPVEPATFPKARQGYQRDVVDRYVLGLQRRLARVFEDRAALKADNARLRAALVELQHTYDRLLTAELDERAQDVLDAAARDASRLVAQGHRDAAELVAQAAREAKVVTERARQEVAWSKRRLRADLADLARQQQALHDQLSSLRDLAVDTAREFPAPPELTFDEVSDPGDSGDETAAAQQPSDHAVTVAQHA